MPDFSDPQVINQAAQSVDPNAQAAQRQLIQQIAQAAQQKQSPGLEARPGAGTSAPIMSRLLMGLKNPQNLGIQPGGRPMSRANVFEDFLGHFLYSMGQGFANAGTGPGAFSRGFGAAVTAGPELQMKQQQLQSQVEDAQAKANEANARAQQIRSQGDTVQTPLGPMSKDLAEKVYPAAIRGQVQNQIADKLIASREMIAKNADDLKQKEINIQSLNSQWRQAQGQEKINIERQVLAERNSYHQGLLAQLGELRKVQEQHLQNNDTISATKVGAQMDEVAAKIAASTSAAGSMFGTPASKAAPGLAQKAAGVKQKLAPIAAGGGNAKISEQDAMGYLNRAGGNKDLARKLAKADGKDF